MSVVKARTIGLAVAAALFAVDQWVKSYLMDVVRIRSVEAIELLPFFDLRFTQNYGVSLGMLTAHTPEMRWALVGMTALIALVVLVWMMREKLLADIIPLALVLGGALGNIRDRYSRGYVVDYADLHFGDFRPFLIFNIADAAITIGVVLILARSLFSREKPGQPAEPETAPES
jgi:signal peptidase II